MFNVLLYSPSVVDGNFLWRVNRLQPVPQALLLVRHERGDNIPVRLICLHDYSALRQTVQ